MSWGAMVTMSALNTSLIIAMSVFIKPLPLSSDLTESQEL